MLEPILQTFLSQDFLEYSGLLLGIAYVVLAANNNIKCWYFGILSCLAIAIKDFFSYQLYADGILQIFYIIMGFTGLYLWKYGKKENQERKISRWTLRNHLPFGLSILILTAVIGYYFAHYTDAAFPYLDSFTTLLSVYATYLLVYRVWDNWILWIVADLIYIYLYYSREAPFFASLMLIYTVVAIFGMYNWNKKWNLEQNSI